MFCSGLDCRVKAQDKDVAGNARLWLRVVRRGGERGRGETVMHRIRVSLIESKVHVFGGASKRGVVAVYLESCACCSLVKCN